MFSFGVFSYGAFSPSAMRDLLLRPLIPIEEFILSALPSVDEGLPGRHPFESRPRVSTQSRSD